jgi:trk system potassium uptake protein TrkA
VGLLADEQHPAGRVAEHVGGGLAHVELAEPLAPRDAEHDHLRAQLTDFVDDRRTCLAGLEQFGADRHLERLAGPLGSVEPPLGVLDPGRVKRSDREPASNLEHGHDKHLRLLAAGEAAPDADGILIGVAPVDGHEDALGKMLIHGPPMLAAELRPVRARRGSPPTALRHAECGTGIQPGSLYNSGVKILIVGCGRVGTSLARDFDSAGHAVTVIDISALALRRLGEDFSGEMVVGTGLHAAVLRGAGIETADAFASVTNGDNRNIMAAEIAQVIFKVPRVIARIYDPVRAATYRELGLETICSTRIVSSIITDYLVTGDNRARELEADDVTPHAAGTA